MSWPDGSGFCCGCSPSRAARWPLRAACASVCLTRRAVEAWSRLFTLAARLLSSAARRSAFLAASRRASASGGSGSAGPAGARGGGGASAAGARETLFCARSQNSSRFFCPSAAKSPPLRSPLSSALRVRRATASASSASRPASPQRLPFGSWSVPGTAAGSGATDCEAWRSDRSSRDCRSCCSRAVTSASWRRPSSAAFTSLSFASWR
mmetsp:Transcript_18683/g.51431  ORF Transcript_18683/g.51431 Transcript_18683/m.51431 type:complete len:209 (+) Transcript_18683:480-1106(+)